MKLGQHLSFIKVAIVVISLIAQPIYAQTPIAEAVLAEQPDNAGSQESEQESEQQEQTTEQEQQDLGLSEVINAEQWSSEWLGKLNEYLATFGLSDSWWGQLIVTVVIAIILMIIVFVTKRVIFGLINKAIARTRFMKTSNKRLGIYTGILSIAINIAAVSLFLLSISGIWGFADESSVIYSSASEVFQFIATFVFLFALGAAAFELANGVLEFNLSRWRRSNNARVNTLLPIAKNFINIILFVVLGITLISELGIDVMPLLAGAGVIGFAIGFGAQTLIKDLITGFIIIFEDLVQVGDVVTVGEKTGIVEKITIRKIQLRTLAGAVITVPFSEISIVENLTKEFSYYLMNIGIAYRESPDEAIKVIKEIGEQMQKDEQYEDLILEPIEVLGVDAFADSAVVIKARIKTLPIKQWQVGREFNRRLKYRFDEVGIEIPFPHQTIYFGEDKEGNAPPANIQLRQSANEDAVPGAQ